jgi:insulysin
MATPLAPPIVPDIDERPQRLVMLRNGLTCLLVSDMHTLISAAALTVGCGQMDDPSEVQGLAHFLEHMVFLGSDKYPDENEFDQYCGKHSGHSNAYTSMHNTTFYYCLSHEGLEGSLDRFSGFFECPTLSEGSSDREMKAVDSENNNNLQSDAHREYQLTRTTGTPGHPWSMFGTGNYESLHDMTEKSGVSITSHLHAFHKLHYTALNMRLAVVGRNTLDQLEEWAVKYFSAIPARPLSERVPHPIPFASDDWFQFYRIIPVNGTPQLNFAWSLPETITGWRNKPFRLLSFCLGHEGPGSVLALLKSRGWANDLMAGIENSLRDFAVFKCNVTLTAEGFKNWRSIAHLIHRYIDIMKSAPQSQCAALFEEVILIEEASFKFQKKQDSETLVQNASSGMLEYPPEFCHFASQCFLEKDFRFEEWQRWLTYLCDSGKNMRVHLIAPKETHEEDTGGELQWLSERWYKTQYHTQPLFLALASDPSSPAPVSFAALAALGAAADSLNELRLPPSNPYLPSNFSMLSIESTCDPTPVLTAERAVTWAATEVSLKEPRLGCVMQLQVPWADSDVESYVAIAAMVKVIEETFSSAKYLAEEAHYDIMLTHLHASCITSGLRISLVGFSDKFDVVLQDLCATIAAPSLSPDLFAYVIETYQQIFDELKVSDAYTFCLRPGDTVRKQPWYSEDAKEKALHGLTLDKLRDVHARFMRECFATVVMCGNVSLAAAADLSKMALQKLGLPIVPAAANTPTPAFTQAPHVALQVCTKFCLHSREDCIHSRYLLQLPSLLRIDTVLWSVDESNIR